MTNHVIRMILSKATNKRLVANIRIEIEPDRYHWKGYVVTNDGMVRPPH